MIELKRVVDFPNSLINYKNRFFWLLVLHIIFNVSFWNTTSRIEYRTKYFTHLIGDSKLAVYIHSVMIFLFGLSRNYLYRYVVNINRSFVPIKGNQLFNYFGYLIITFGTILVVTSTYKLGIIGVYNADAFGFPLPYVVSFPYNLFRAPMYLGSTLNFLGYAVIKKSYTGLFFSYFVGIVYFCGSLFEE